MEDHGKEVSYGGQYNLNATPGRYFAPTNTKTAAQEQSISAVIENQRQLLSELTEVVSELGVKMEPYLDLTDRLENAKMPKDCVPTPVMPILERLRVSNFNIYELIGQVRALRNRFQA